MSVNSAAPLLRHYLAALAYRTQKALRDAPSAFGDFRAAPGVRTPRELVRHMTGVLGYARTFFVGGTFEAEPLPSLAAEIARFHEMLELAGSPVPAENFLKADVRPDNLGADQAEPRAPGRRDGKWDPRGVVSEE
jgi:hypothetical protein